MIHLEDVIDSFDDIRQNLSEIAGVNTSMDLDFEHVTVNSNPIMVERTCSTMLL